MNALVVGNFEFGEVVVGHRFYLLLICSVVTLCGLCLSMTLRGKRASKAGPGDA
ncbi:hypothetical protein QR685DRAFT_527382 [Neurospora intermedia]|uniref:Uncharacterized protein n=1 Tax=Neurospora intermedia TaxID=5142 RepID=A0ABR3DAN6_NEUIN